MGCDIRSTLLLDNRDAITPVIGAFLVIAVVMSVTGGVLYWGVPYIEQNRASTQVESVYSQLNVFDTALQDLIHEGPGASRESKISVGSGSLDVEKDSDRFICMYSLDSHHNFTVSDLDDQDKSFTLYMTKGNATKVKAYWMGLNDPELDIIADEDVVVSSDGIFSFYLKFNLSYIPKNAVVESAWLRLYIAEKGKNWNNSKLYIYNVENKWSETSDAQTFSDLASLFSHYIRLCNDAPLFQSGDVSDSVTKAYVEDNKFCSFKITTSKYDKNHINKVQPHTKHLLLGEIDNGRYIKFYSCESTKTILRPELVVYYHIPDKPTIAINQQNIFGERNKSSIDHYKYIIYTPSYTAYFKELINNDDSVRFSKGKYWITFQPLTSNQFIKGYQKENKVIYSNVFGKKINLEYICRSSILKENIIIHNVSSLSAHSNFNATFKIAYDVNNLSLVLDNKSLKNLSHTKLYSANIVFKDRLKNISVFSLEKPYVHDSANNALGLKYILKLDGDALYLTLTIPLEWLLNKTRVYPIVIDPTIKNNIYDFSSSNSEAYKYENGTLPPYDYTFSGYQPYTSSERGNIEYYDSKKNLMEGGRGHGYKSNEGIHYKGYYTNIYYKFKINEDPASITQLNVTWVGYDTLSNGGEFVICIWNFSSSSWKILEENTSSQTSDQTYVISLSSSISDYINGSGYIIVGIAGAKGPDNTAPNTPAKPSGTTSGDTGKSYTYTTSTTDPENDMLKYEFDWGDESNTTTSWYNSGATATASHSWSKSGTYYVKVKAFDGANWSGWSNSLKVSISGGVTVPTARTDDASSVGASSATLNGYVVDDGGEACQYRFRYRKYGSSTWTYTPSSWTGSKTTGQSFSASISDLSSGTTYEFQAGLKNSAGTDWGSSKTFTTLSGRTTFSEYTCRCTFSKDRACQLLLHPYVSYENTSSGLSFPFYDASTYSPLYNIRLVDKNFSGFKVDYLGKPVADSVSNSSVLDETKYTVCTIYENYVAVEVYYNANSPPDTKIVSGPEEGSEINESDVSFQWTATDDTTPTSDLVYQYYLQGYDIGWQPGPDEWTSSTSVTYHNLNRGDYIFKVRAKDGDGNIESEEDSNNTRSFTIIPAEETFNFKKPVKAPSGYGVIEFKTRNLTNFVLIELYDGNTLFGKIWLFDLSSINYRLSSPSGRYKLSTENAAIVKTEPSGYSFIRNNPIIYSDSQSFSLHIVQLVTSSSGGGGGKGIYRLSSRILENSIRDNTRITILKLQIYGDSEEAWFNYFIKNYNFKEGPAIIGQHTIYYHPKNKINFVLSHSIVKTIFRGVY